MFKLVLNLSLNLIHEIPGGLAGGAPPVPIPNTEVKPSKADDTAAVRPWESRTLPGFKRPAGRKISGLFYAVMQIMESDLVSQLALERRERFCNASATSMI